MPWHQKLARDAGIAAADLEALRSGAPLSDPKLEALHRFTRVIVRERGKISAAVAADFISSGYDSRQILEVILGVAIKTMSNYTNAIARVPLDEAVRDEA